MRANTCPANPETQKMPSILFACPHCRQTFTADSGVSGKAVGCPRCGQRFRAPPAPPAPLAVRPGPTKPRRLAARRRPIVRLMVVALSTTAVSLAIAAGVLWGPRLRYWSFGLGNQQASARAALAAQLDKWMARQPHEAEHVELLMAVLLDYSIQSLQPVKTTLVDLPFPDWDKYRGPDAVYSELPITYVAAVRVNVESQAGTALPRVVLYRLTWDPEARKWRIQQTMNGK